METVSESIAIGAPPERVFAIAGSYENDPRWRGSVTTMRQDPAGAVAAGTKLHEVAKFLGMKVEMKARVDEVQPGRRVAYTSTSTPKPVRGWRDFAPEGDGTLVTIGVEVVAGGSLGGVEGLIAKAVRREVKSELKALKALCETKG
ncbi:MAG: SRPBCC family protein [Tepidiformaceae bacterium]